MQKKKKKSVAKGLNGDNSAGKSFFTYDGLLKIELKKPRTAMELI